jgi:hypothetical protein
MKLTPTEKDRIAKRALRALNRLNASKIQTSVDEQSIRRWLIDERDQNDTALFNCDPVER